MDDTGGIVFFRTESLQEVVDFYTDLGATVWLEQPDCTVLDHAGFRFGFCEREGAETCGIVTFYYPEKSDVDAMYDRLEARADGPPRRNAKYDIYQFFAADPEGRTVEFQVFR